MRKRSKYVLLSMVTLFIIVFSSLLLTYPSKVQDTNSNVLDGERLWNTQFNNLTGVVMLQSAPLSNTQNSISEVPLPCNGPRLIASIDRTEIEINQAVTVTGYAFPPEQNIMVRVIYVRPDYSTIEHYVPANPQTGEFTHTQVLDMGGYWNIFPNHGSAHASDWLHAIVTDPSGAIGDPSDYVSPWKTNIPLVITAIILGCVGIIVAITGLKKKTRRISSLRFCIPLLLIFLMFAGMFVDHPSFPNPTRQMAVHNFFVGTNVFGVSLPEGFPVPFLACQFPCGGTVTCALWGLQVYIYPFFEAGHGWGVDYNTSGISRLVIIVSMLILSALLLGRFWCGWVCPFGLYQDVLMYVRKWLKIKHFSLPVKFSEHFHQFSYVILATMLILSVLFASETLIGTQLIPGTEVGGVISTFYPAPFCAVCPMRPLCLLLQNQAGVMPTQGIFSSAMGTFYELGWFLTSVNLIILAVVTIAAFFVKRVWCRICPMGGLLGLFSRFAPFKWLTAVSIVKSEEKCDRCGVCKRVCPMQVKEVYEKKEGNIMTSQCIGCLHCIEMCPHEGALKFKFAGQTVCRSKND